MKLRILRLFLFVVMAAILVCQAIGDSNSKLEFSLLGSDTFWGAETNGIQSALHVEIIPGTNVLIRCTPILKNNHTNILLLYFPPLKNRYVMELKDSNGKSVGKTEVGNALNEILTEPFGATIDINRRAGYRRLPPMDPNYSSQLDGYDFNLKDYFQMTNSGKYNLTFQIRVIYFPPGWKGSIKPKSTNVPVINLPAINAQIEVRQTTLH